MTRAPFSQEAFEADLNSWIDQAPENEREARAKAANQIHLCKAENGTFLYLMRFGLTSLPDSIGNLASLEELNLSANQLQTFPNSIRNRNT